MEWTKGEFRVSDEAPLPIEQVHALLQTTYWSANRPLDVVEGILNHSLCFSLWRYDELIGFARAISDYTTTTWLADMVILDDLKGQGLGGWLLDCLMQHPQLAGTQFVLQTKDAHTFYGQHGFAQRDTLMSTAVPYL